MTNTAHTKAQTDTGLVHGMEDMEAEGDRRGGQRAVACMVQTMKNNRRVTNLKKSR